MSEQEEKKGMWKCPQGDHFHATPEELGTCVCRQQLWDKCLDAEDCVINDICLDIFSEMSEHTGKRDVIALLLQSITRADKMNLVGENWDFLGLPEALQILEIAPKRMPQQENLLCKTCGKPLEKHAISCVVENHEEHYCSVCFWQLPNDLELTQIKYVNGKWVQSGGGTFHTGKG